MAKTNDLSSGDESAFDNFDFSKSASPVLDSSNNSNQKISLDGESAFDNYDFSKHDALKNTQPINLQENIQDARKSFLGTNDKINPSSSFNSSKTLDPGSMNQFIGSVEAAGLGELKGAAAPIEGLVNKVYPKKNNPADYVGINNPQQNNERTLLNFNNIQAVKDHPVLYRAAQFPGNMLVSGAVSAIAPELAPGVIESSLGTTLANAGIQGGVQGALGYIQSKDHPYFDTLLSAGLGSGGRIVGDALPSMFKSDFTKTPKEIRDTVAAQNEPGMTPVKLSAGDIVGSPSIRRDTYFASKLPVSGVTSDARNVQNQLDSRSQDIIHSMLPKIDNNIEGTIDGEKLSNYHHIFETVASTAKKGIDDIENISHNNYAQSMEKAKKAGIRIDPEEYRNTARKLLQAHEGPGGLAQEYPIARYDADTIALLKNAASKTPDHLPAYSKVVDENGRPFTLEEGSPGDQTKSFANTSSAIQNLNKRGRETNDRVKSMVINKLNSALRNDFERGIDKAGNIGTPEAQDAISSWKNAQQFFKNDVVPYRGMDVDSQGNPLSGQQYIKNFIQRGALTNPNISKKLVSLMPENSKNIPLVADGENLKELPGLAFLLANSPVSELNEVMPNSASIIKAYESLKNPITKNNLFPNSKKSLDNLQLLHKSSAESRNNLLFNPNNGKLASNFLGMGIAGSSLGGGLLGGYELGKKATDGSFAGGLAGAGLGGLASVLAGRSAGAALSNPAVRDYIIRNGGYLPQNLRHFLVNNPNALGSSLSGITNTYQG